MIGGKANMPLSMAFCWICLARSRIWSSSAVEARTNSTGNWPPPGRAGGVTGNIRMPGMACSLLLHLGQDLENGALPLVPGFDHHAAETGGREGDLEGELCLRHAEKGAVGRRGVDAGLVEGGIGRGIDDAENDPLVLGGGKFLGRHGEHGDDRKTEHDPDQVDRRPGAEGEIQPAAVGSP